MTKIARYIIVLDRYDDDELHWNGDGHANKEGMEQVARELQEAIEQIGQPAGFFHVVTRTEPMYDGINIANCDHKTAFNKARMALCGY